MAPSNPSAATGLLNQRSDKPLETHIHLASEKGLSSITTLIVGPASNTAVIIDPPFLNEDAESFVRFVHEKAPGCEVLAAFSTHWHPDHYWAVDVLLKAFPKASFFAAPYVCEGIDREYEEKCKFWPGVYGDAVHPRPTKPKPYPYSFFIVPGHSNSPVVLLGPVQGDCADHSMFWLPREKTVITGDCVYGRSTHVWVEEIETPTLLEAWKNILDLIDGMEIEKIIPGHLESGWELDRDADMAHNRKYLDLFATKIAYAEKKATKDDIYQTFEKAFPDCKANLGFFLGMLSNTHGSDGKVWEENRHHNVGARTPAGLEGFVIGNDVKLKEK
ncbi:hypothetical protein OIO90_004458 [Microbotryomycetes sp. JL221]|nr:hypothetical protein OIO90_004458 [Microbotryomycetes sp. JL221]